MVGGAGQVPVTSTVTEYVKVPRGCDPAEIWAPEGAPLSLAFVEALRRRPAASAALRAAVALAWGAPLLVTRRSFARMVQTPPPTTQPQRLPGPPGFSASPPQQQQPGALSGAGLGSAV